MTDKKELALEELEQALVIILNCKTCDNYQLKDGICKWINVSHPFNNELNLCKNFHRKKDA